MHGVTWICEDFPIFWTYGKTFRVWQTLFTEIGYRKTIYNIICNISNRNFIIVLILERNFRFIPLVWCLWRRWVWPRHDAPVWRLRGRGVRTRIKELQRGDEWRRTYGKRERKRDRRIERLPQRWAKGRVGDALPARGLSRSVGVVKIRYVRRVVVYAGPRTRTTCFFSLPVSLSLSLSLLLILYVQYIRILYCILCYSIPYTFMYTECVSWTAPNQLPFTYMYANVNVFYT